VIALSSLLKGLNKLILNEEKLDSDLNDNWAVVSEAIQTILRREGYPEPYEVLLNLTRNNQKVSQTSLIQFIDSLDLPWKIKDELKAITPFNYTGI
jgi:adenylosuccinate lyase